MVYRRTYQNYIDIIRKKRSNSFPIIAKLRKGTEVKIHNLFQLRMYEWKIQDNCSFEDDLLTINLPDYEIKFFDWEYNGDIFPIFFAEDYGSLPVKNSVVIDVGANIGDSSIYFALNGAKKVLAFEPSPKNFKSAVKNVKKNGLEDIIEVINAGCSGKTGNMMIEEKKDGIFYSMEEKKDGYSIPIVSLSEILKKIHTSSCILKIDCEGCEYETLLSASEQTLRHFSHIFIEYHYGYCNLQEKLENSSFKVSVTKPKLGKTFSKQFKNTFFGYLYAERKNG